MNLIQKWIESKLVEFLQRMIGLGKSVKFSLVLTMDALLCVAAVWIAFSLRLGEWQLWNNSVRTVLITSLATWLIVFLARGTYKSMVRFTGIRTITDITISCALMAIGLSVIFTSFSMQVPRTIGAILSVVFAMLLIISRTVAGYLLFDLLKRKQFSGIINKVLIYGAGATGRQLSASIRHEPGMLLQGYIDDNKRLVGQRLDGVRIHHSDQVLELISRLQVNTVLLAIPRLSRQRRDEIMRQFKGISVHILTLPAVSEIVDGSVSIADMREVEIADLLGRDAVPPNTHLLHRTITGRSVMVTGAGGSIGSELCRQIGLLNPKRLILVEMTEHALYAIEGEMIEAQKNGSIDVDVTIHTELGSVSDAGTVRRLFDRWQPETVFHAAAYKHVPLVEQNVIAGMRNNIFGTLFCALEAERCATHNFILVSTDKAVRPTNVMGATKRACELVLQALAARNSATRFTMVRFGNVLGSSGSVVPRFQRQIREGGPITLTHRDVTRYFMTIPEAAQLVIQAGAMAKGGEVFVLDMGEPIRIYDLARTMVQLSGLTIREDDNPDGDIEIREIGLRQGEKLFEELLIGNAAQPTDHPRIMQAREAFIQWSELSNELTRLQDLLEKGERNAALSLLSTLVPEFNGSQSVPVST